MVEFGRNGSAIYEIFKDIIFLSGVWITDPEVVW